MVQVSCHTPDGSWEQEMAPRPGRNSGAGVISVGFVLVTDEVSGLQVIARA